MVRGEGVKAEFLAGGSCGGYKVKGGGSVGEAAGFFSVGYLMKLHSRAGKSVQGGWRRRHEIGLFRRHSAVFGLPSARAISVARAVAARYT